MGRKGGEPAISLSLDVIPDARIFSLQVRRMYSGLRHPALRQADACPARDNIRLGAANLGQTATELRRYQGDAPQVMGIANIQALRLLEG